MDHWQKRTHLWGVTNEELPQKCPNLIKRPIVVLHVGGHSRKGTPFWGPSLIRDPDSRSLLESVEHLQFDNNLVFSVALFVSGHLFLIRKNFLS